MRCLYLFESKQSEAQPHHTARVVPLHPNGSITVTPTHRSSGTSSTPPAVLGRNPRWDIFPINNVTLPLVSTASAVLTATISPTSNRGSCDWREGAESAMDELTEGSGYHDIGCSKKYSLVSVAIALYNSTSVANDKCKKT
jgi:hypothetical protein